MELGIDTFYCFTSKKREVIEKIKTFLKSKNIDSKLVYLEDIGKFTLQVEGELTLRETLTRGSVFCIKNYLYKDVKYIGFYGYENKNLYTLAKKSQKVLLYSEGTKFLKTETIIALEEHGKEIRNFTDYGEKNF